MRFYSPPILHMAGTPRTTHATRRCSPTFLSLVLVLLFIPLIPGATSNWTLVLSPAQASAYLSCVSQHSGYTGECWVALSKTTTTLPPSTVTSEVFVPVTATILSDFPSPSSSPSSSIPGTAAPASTVSVLAPMHTSPPTTAKASAASWIEPSRPLLSLALALLLVPATLQLARG